jgi:gluconokinase
VADRPTVLAIDIASGGVTASLVGEDLKPFRSVDVPWTFVDDGDGGAGLAASNALDSVFAAMVECVADQTPPDAMVLSSMMHTLVVTTVEGMVRSPVFTWKDRRNGGFAATVLERLGDYRARTGCHFHPSFPSFKLAWLQWSRPKILEGEYRLRSLKALVQDALTGNPAEDVSSISASGLGNLETGGWDTLTLEVLGIAPDALGPAIDSQAIAGGLKSEMAARLGLPEALPVIAGAGDGFFATTGSGCDDASRVAITLGTTASVRRFVGPADASSNDSTFCYRYDSERFLNGCASSNGGNVLDWAAEALGSLDGAEEAPEPPLFLPFLNGERAPFWDASLEPRWVGVNGSSLPELKAAIVESQAFALAAYFEITTAGSKRTPDLAVLSGNGFLDQRIGPMLAALIPVPVLEPAEAGLATIRGATRCGFEAMGMDTNDAMERFVDQAIRVKAAPKPALQSRYERFRDVYLSA